MHISPPSPSPLDTVTLHGASGRIQVLDGQGRRYDEAEAEDLTSWTVGGALGSHTVLVLDSQDRVRETLAFPVRTRTDLRRGTGTGRLRTRRGRLRGRHPHPSV